jgi:uncharacterized protein
VYILIVALALLQIGTAALALTFPPLTGRVVDQAGIIPPDTQATLRQELANLESRSGIQLVVATVSSLEGQDIGPYANELFRTWRLGETQKNNGVLLLVAPNEHRVRIEVGYGLEGTLTDALTNVIITNAITPRFKQGDFGGGIQRGAEDIITALTSDSSQWQQRAALRLDSQPADPMNWLLIAGLIGIGGFLVASPSLRFVFFNMLLNSGGGFGGMSGGAFPMGFPGGFPGGRGGGFSGGGGSSGGGGASEGW